MSQKTKKQPKEIDYREKTKKLIHEFLNPQEETCNHENITRDEFSHYGIGGNVGVTEGYNTCNKCKKKQFFREMRTAQLGLYNEHKSGFYSQ
jgi:hypothetical protein